MKGKTIGKEKEKSHEPLGWNGKREENENEHEEEEEGVGRVGMARGAEGGGGGASRTTNRIMEGVVTRKLQRCVSSRSPDAAVLTFAAVIKVRCSRPAKCSLLLTLIYCLLVAAGGGQGRQAVWKGEAGVEKGEVEHGGEVWRDGDREEVKRKWAWWRGRRAWMGRVWSGFQVGVKQGGKVER